MKIVCTLAYEVEEYRRYYWISFCQMVICPVNAP